MSSTFALLDLPSQALAVQRVLKGQSNESRLNWLANYGTVRLGPASGSIQAYWFVSRLGLECAFFFDGDEIVFLGDHTTFVMTNNDQT